MTTDVQSTIKAAMAVAKDVAEGRLLPAQVDAAALEACRGIVGVVVGPNDPLWPLQTEIARQVIAAGGIHANELSEWLAVQRRRDGIGPGADVQVVTVTGGPIPPDSTMTAELAELPEDIPITRE